MRVRVSMPQAHVRACGILIESVSPEPKKGKSGYVVLHIEIYTREAEKSQRDTYLRPSKKDVRGRECELRKSSLVLPRMPKGSSTLNVAQYIFCDIYLYTNRTNPRSARSPHVRARKHCGRLSLLPLIWRVFVAPEALLTVLGPIYYLGM